MTLLMIDNFILTCSVFDYLPELLNRSTIFGKLFLLLWYGGFAASELLW